MSLRVKNILVVDDAKHHLYLLESILSFEGYSVFTSDDPKKALIMLEEIEVDLILLDIMMPDLDGFQVLDILYKNPNHKDIPVIILSAKSDPKVIQKAIKLGAQDYIVKPVNVRDVQNKVKSILSNKTIQNEK